MVKRVGPQVPKLKYGPPLLIAYITALVSYLPGCIKILDMLQVDSLNQLYSKSTGSYSTGFIECSDIF